MGIVMYGTTWCGDCARSKLVFERMGVDYEWVNIEEDVEAAGKVMALNDGRQVVPTIVFEDGVVLVEPGDAVLEEKLGSSKS